jgi:hypothetical protein
MILLNAFSHCAFSPHYESHSRSQERRKTLTGHFKAELYKIAVNLYILYEKYTTTKTTSVNGGIITCIKDQIPRLIATPD